MQGYQGEHSTRTKRAIQKHTLALIAAGFIEKVEVGQTHINCLRLTKYNPEYDPAAHRPVETVEDTVEEVPEIPDQSLGEMSL